MRRWVSVLEDFMEGRVRERLEQEFEVILDHLEQNLPREEFVRVLEIVSEENERHGG
jgi:hypothetical protein